MIKVLKKCLTKKQIIYLKRQAFLRDNLDLAFCLGPGVLEEFYSFGTSSTSVTNYYPPTAFPVVSGSGQYVSPRVHSDSITRSGVGYLLDGQGAPAPPAARGILTAAYYICIPLTPAKPSNTFEFQRLRLKKDILLARRRLVKVNWDKIISDLTNMEGNRCTYHVYCIGVNSNYPRVTVIPRCGSYGLLIRVPNIFLLDLHCNTEAEMVDPYSGICGVTKQIQVLDRLQSGTAFEFSNAKPTLMALKKSKELVDLMNYNVGINRVMDSIVKRGRTAPASGPPNRKDMVSLLDVGRQGPSILTNSFDKLFCVLIINTLRRLRSQSSLTHLYRQGFGIRNLSVAVVSKGGNGNIASLWNLDLVACGSSLEPLDFLIRKCTGGRDTTYTQKELKVSLEETFNSCFAKLV